MGLQPSGMAGEHPQQVELAPGQVDRLAGPGHRTDGGVDPQIPDLDHRGRRGAAPVAQQAADPRQQFLHPEGLDHIILRPGIQRGDLAGLVAADRQHDHRRRGPGPDLGQHRQAVGIGQAKVEDHQRRDLAGHGGDPVAGGGCLDHAMALGLERDAQ